MAFPTLMSDSPRRLAVPPELARYAVDLASHGIHELAWPRAAVLALLQRIEPAGLVILGGDALSSVAPPAYANANWHVAPRTGEEPLAYSARSCRAARKYIEQYPEPNAWFVLVLRHAIIDLEAAT